MTTSREILCGITYDQLAQVAITHPDRREASKKLGVCEEYLRQVLKRKGMLHWFRTIPRKPGPTPLLSREDVLSVKGMLLSDAAECLGVHQNTLAAAIKREGLRGEFPNHGEAIWISKRGYAG